ncbi:MAG: hypothetical protein WCF95_03585 [bacterium]
MINDILNSLKTTLEADESNPCVELFFRDISQYKYICQNPVAIINLRGADFEKPPHISLSGQKGVLDVSFFYFLRTLENSNTQGVLDFFESVKKLDGVLVQSLKAYSHRKNTSIWEIKTQIITMF